LAQVDQIFIGTEGFVFVDNFTQSGNRSDFTELSNVVSVYKDLRISMWLLIGSAVTGLLILICVSVCLAKAGFFERKQHALLRQLKEEAMEEEKLIEDMIQKEREQSNEPFEGDPVFRYLKPKELEMYWKRLEDGPAHKSASLKDQSDDLLAENQ